MFSTSARTALKSVSKRSASIMKNHVSAMSSFQTLAVTQPKEFVFQVELNRPNNLNAFNKAMWLEIPKCFEELDANEDCRAIVVTGAGKLFSAGLDLKEVMTMAPEFTTPEDVARKAKVWAKYITLYQKTVTSLELCRKPVLAAVHSACVGAGINLITAADIRYCTKDAFFQVKEVDIGMAADVGVLQRLPKVIGSDSLVRELCYTARKLPADEALSCGLVSKVFENKESMLQHVLEIAEAIAQKSPVAVQATKQSLVYSRDHTVQEGLNQLILMNRLNMQSEDFINAVMAQLSKEKAVFAKL